MIVAFFALVQKASTKASKKAGTSTKESKRSSKKRSASSALVKKMDPAEAARLEKNRIKAQRHRDKMKVSPSSEGTRNRCFFLFRGGGWGVCV